MPQVRPPLGSHLQRTRSGKENVPDKAHSPDWSSIRRYSTEQGTQRPILSNANRRDRRDSVSYRSRVQDKESRDSFSNGLAAWRYASGKDDLQERKEPERRESRLSSSSRLPHRNSNSTTTSGTKLILGYDFEKAIDPRLGATRRFSKNTSENIDKIYRKHMWVKHHIVVNMYSDLKSHAKVEQILDVVAETQRSRFNREKIGVRGGALALQSKEKEARRLSIGMQNAERRRTQDTYELNQAGKVLVSDERLEIMRSNLRKLLDEQDKMKDDQRRESISSDGRRSSFMMSEKVAAVYNKVVLDREDLIEAIISSRSYSDRGEVDLHGLSVQNSIHIVERILRNQKDFFVITGRGLHSKDNICVLAREMQAYLTAKDVPFTVGEGKEIGRIFIEPRRRSSQWNASFNQNIGAVRTSAKFGAFGRIPPPRK